MRRALLLAAAILALAVPGTALAAVSVHRVVPDTPGNGALSGRGRAVGAFAGPALAGSLPVFVTGARRRWTVWVGSSPIQGARTAPAMDAEAAASDGHVAVHFDYYDRYGFADDDWIVAGPPSGPLTQIFDCAQWQASPCGCAARSAFGAPTVAVSGSALAAGGCGRHVLVFDPVGGPGTTVTDVDSDTGLRGAFAMAGDHVAELLGEWSEPSTLRIVDRRTRAVERDIPLGFVADTVSVQSDGTAVVQASDGAAVLFTPGDPPPRLLPLPRLAHVVGIAGGRIAYVVPGAPERIAVVDLAGNPVATTTAFSAVGGAAFDGSRLAWAVQPCATALVYVWDLTGAAPVTPPGPCPVPRLAFGRIRPGTGHVPIDVRCPRAATLGCAGDLTLRTSEPFGFVPRRLRTPMLHRLFVLGAGQTRRITAKLHHLIPRRRTHPYRFAASASVPGSAGYPGRQVRVRTTLAP